MTAVAEWLALNGSFAYNRRGRSDDHSSPTSLISRIRVPYEDESAADNPRVAPDAVVEVLSPRDQKKDVEDKIRVYLSCGASVIFLVDTTREAVTARDCTGEQLFQRDDTVTHPSLPDFAVPVSFLFARPRPKQ